MNVLGLFGFGMNPGACLLRDGELVAFGEEERFVRVKTAPDHFPGRAAAYCLREAGLALDDVDRIAFAWDTGKYPFRMLTTLARQYARHRTRAGSARDPRRRGSSTLSSAMLNVLKYTPSRLREEIRLGLRSAGLSGEVPEVEFVPHHLAHAYSAYFASPFEEALILTLDGSGEDICTQIAVGRGDRLEVRRSIPIPHSLGWYYAAFTAYFGFQSYRHEGKLMGLAGLGHERADQNPWLERLAPVLAVNGGDYQVDPTFTRFGRHTYAERFTDRLVKLVTGHDPRLAPVSSAERHRMNGSRRYLDPGYVDLAWGVQARLEQAVTGLARQAASEEGGLRNLCVAGGVGLNCKLNGALQGPQGFDEVFVQPAAHDAGSAIGAAMRVAEQGGDRIRRRLEHVNFGPQFDNDQIRRILRQAKLRAEEPEDLPAAVAEDLARGKLVGWFQGRAEYGPRALGARSILASPQLEGVTDQLNLEVKAREAWRPFCPSILEEEAGEHFVGCRQARFMTTAFEVCEDHRADMRAAMHVDGSARPQTVDAEHQPRFHALLSEFRERSGLPYVINTSFNVAGEPIVATPEQALRCFYSTGLDTLALGDFLLRKG